jgi:hypothetical protein
MIMDRGAEGKEERMKDEGSRMKEYLHDPASFPVGAGPRACPEMKEYFHDPASFPVGAGPRACPEMKEYFYDPASVPLAVRRSAANNKKRGAANRAPFANRTE